LGLDIDVVRDVCAKTDCDVANDNCPGQVVISGAKEIVEDTMEKLKAAGAKRAMPLALSVPVHCRMQESAADAMRAALGTIEIRMPRAVFISNKTADAMTKPDEIKDELIYQMTHGVRWRESVLKMHELGIIDMVEIGPGNVLTGLAARICPEINAKKLEI